jgi:SAM-dependent methyltransferase
VTVFDAYSAYYDLLYRDKDYPAETRYVMKLINQTVPRCLAVLDLGCGTGPHAALLADHGIAVTGVDMSKSMLAGAVRRRDQLHQDLQSRLTFHQGDMRTVRLERQYDVVLSLFHAISYQVGTEDLLAAFRTARNHVGPEGCFIFDFWYGPAVLTQRPEPRLLSLANKTVRVTRFASPELRANENVVHVNYDILVENKDADRIERINERHTMRYLFLPELANLLHQCQLRLVDAKGWMLDSEPDCNTWAAVVTAKPN